MGRRVLRAVRTIVQYQRFLDSELEFSEERQDVLVLLVPLLDRVELAVCQRHVLLLVHWFSLAVGASAKLPGRERRRADLVRPLCAHASAHFHGLSRTDGWS